jgi:hypothetical protein
MSYYQPINSIFAHNQYLKTLYAYYRLQEEQEVEKQQ